MMRVLASVILAVGAAFVLCLPASAAPIAIANNSFETPSTGGFQDNNGIAAGTALPNMSDSWYYLGGFSANGSPVGVENTAANGGQTGGDGTQNGYVNVGAALGSANLGLIEANKTYNLTVGVTGRFNGFNSTAGAAIALASVASGTPGDTDLANPANWLASNSIDFATLSAAGGMFNDYQASFSTGAAGGAIGQQLVVVLMSQNNAGASNPIDFENVRLEAVVPEPASLLMLAIGGVLALGCVRRGKS
jgi:HpiC1 cyclase/PEP-CTERM motif